MKKVKIQKHQIINALLVFLLLCGVGYTIYRFFPQIKELLTPKSKMIVIPPVSQRSFNPTKALQTVQVAQPVIDAILKTIKEIVGLIATLVTTYFLIKNNTKSKRTARKNANK